MNPRITPTAVLAATLLVLGCTDAERAHNPVAPEVPGLHALAYNSPHEADAHQLARAFAMAMADADVRAHVRNALRASPYVEHKLLLQEFVQTPSGRHLVEAAGRTSGLGRSGVEQLVAGLPAMDFYAPFREHRLSWKGTEDVVVGATMNQKNSRFTAFAAAGTSVGYDAATGAPKSAVLIFHPAEVKDLRINRQRALQGDVIQDPDDGEIGGAILEYVADGSVVERQLADLSANELGLMYIQPPDCHEPHSGVEVRAMCGGGGGSTGGTVFQRFRIYFEDGVGSAEVRFRTFTSANQVGSAFRLTGLRRGARDGEPGEWYVVNRSVVGRYAVDAVETDAFKDDPWGWGNQDPWAEQWLPIANNTAFSTWGHCGPMYSEDVRGWQNLCPNWLWPVRTTDIVMTW